MKQTQNYHLNQWETTDLIKMEDFNGDNSKVDAALAALAGQVASKASSSTVSSLSTKVNTKAAQSDLTAAVNRITALESGKAEKTALAAEQTARENADNAEKAAREDADNVEKAAREAADTALRNENCWVKLSDVTLSQDTESFTMQLPDPDQYAELRCMIAMSHNNCSTYLSLNGGTNVTEDETTAPEAYLMGNGCIKFGGDIRLFPLGSTEDTVLLLNIPYRISERLKFSRYNTAFLAEGLSFSQLQTLSFTSKRKTSDSVQDPPRMLAGSHIRLYGLKK